MTKETLLELVKFQFFEFLAQAIRALAECRGLSDENLKTISPLDFIRTYTAANDKLISRFANSIKSDLPEILNLLSRLNISQLESFGLLLRRYSVSLDGVKPEKESYVLEFYSELTYHITTDLLNFIHESDKFPEKELEIQMSLLDQEAEADAAYFALRAA